MAESHLQQLKFTVVGVSALLLHNPANLADKSSPIAKAIREITDKKGKNRTDSDDAELQRLEHLGGLYLNEDDRVVIPGENIEGMLLAAAKAFRMGPKAKAGCFCEDNFLLSYKGPKKPDELFKARDAKGRQTFVDRRFVVVDRKRIMRTRPRFDSWSLSFQVTYATDVLSPGDIAKWVAHAGRLIGLCDSRPKFGRFKVVDGAEE